MSNISIDNMWIEHQMVMVWGTNVSNLLLTNSRVRNMYADGLNLTNNSKNNTVRNIDARSTGDDAFALFNAIDIVQGDNTGNLWENLSVTTPWRAAGLAVYGGQNNTFRNIYIADTLCYSGITVSSLDFGYQFKGFGTQPIDHRERVDHPVGRPLLGRADLPGASGCSRPPREFRGIRINNIDIVEPTYHGIMFQTKYNGAAEYPHTDTIFNNVSISGCAEERRRLRLRSRASGSTSTRLPEGRSGPGGRLGHLQQPDLQQQLPEHQEHDVDVHPEHQLVPLTEQALPPEGQPPAAAPFPVDVWTSTRTVRGCGP